MKPTFTIAADSPLTAQAGADIARAGGNVVDAAVAAALTAMTSEVLMCSLGGSLFVLLKLPGQAAELIDGADAMPALCRDPQFREVTLAYGDGITVRAGHGTVAVPGALAALELAWQRHGSLPWREVVAPALEVAKRPFPVSPTLGKWLAIAGAQVFYEQPASRACFFPDGKHALQLGETFVLPYMADTLELIADEGAVSLYGGELGRQFAQEMATNGGCVTLDDLKSYKAQVRTPVRLDSAGFQLASNPTPAIGGTAVGFLIDAVQKQWPHARSDAEKVNVLAEAQTALLRIKALQDSLQSPSTTHLSAATSDGAAVSITMSNGYGSGITIPGTGIVCNNSLGEPELNPGGYYGLPPGARMVSNMAPTIASHPDGRVIALGSPGASRITTAIVQTWIQYAFEHKTLQAAVDHPRLHIEEWPDGLRALCEPDLDTALLGDRFRIRDFASRDMFFGAIKACACDANGHLEAAADSRRDGAVRMIP